MAVLSHQSIIERCRGGPGGPLVSPFDEKQVKTAAYDLRVGWQYYVDDPPQEESGAVGVRYLDSDHLTLQIRANQLVLVRTLENLAMPDDLVGHLSLKLDLLLQGVIMASQSQIDAGYAGPIFALLYNLTDSTVTLHHKKSFLRLEFAQLDQRTEQTYAGQFERHFQLAHVVRKRVTSSLEGINRVAQETRNETRNSVRRLGVIGLLALLVSTGAIIYQLLGPLQMSVSDAKSAAEAAREEVEHQRRQLMDFQREIIQLEAEIARLELEGQ